MAGWIARFKKLSGKLRPLAIEVAVFCCKNLGVPGGGLIADALCSVDKLRVDREMAKMDAVLQAVLAQGNRALELLDARNVAPGEAGAALEKMMLREPEARASIQAAMASIEGIPGILEFLRKDIREVLVEVQEVRRRVDVVSEDVRQARGDLGLGQQEIVGLLLDLRKRLELRDKVRMQDSLSVRSESQRRQVREVLQRVDAAPAAVRERPEVLAQKGSVLIAAGEPAAASRCFEQAQARAASTAEQATFAYNAFLAHLQAGELDEALARYLEATRLDPDACELFDGDRFTPTGVLGAGGFGVAFLCRDQVGERRVVKALLADALDPDRVFSEAELLRDIRNDNVARIYEWGWADRKARQGAFIVSEYAGAEDLADAVERRGPMPEYHALPVMLRVAEGLAAAHAKGVIHRDIKPANIIIREEDGTFFPKLIDFGLGVRQETLAGYRQSVSSSAAQRSVFGQEIAGTLAFAPPEQKGELAAPVGPWSDVFAFGRAACFILFGTAQPLRSHWKTVPDALGEVLERCQARDPEERYQSFAAVIEALQGVQAATSSSAVRSRPPPPPAPPAQRAQRPPRKSAEPARPPSPPPPQGAPRKKSSALPMALGCGCLLLVLGGVGIAAASGAFEGGGGFVPPVTPSFGSTTSNDDLIGIWRSPIPEAFTELVLVFDVKGGYSLETYIGGNFSGAAHGSYAVTGPGVMTLTDQFGFQSQVSFELRGSLLTLPIIDYGIRTFERDR